MTIFSKRLLNLLRWLVIGLMGAGALQLAGRIYLFFWPKPTPLIVAPLLRHRWRLRYRDPEHTLAPLRLHPGMRVLELGPGVGLFTACAARAIAPGGVLLSVDLQRAMLDRLRRDLQHTAASTISLQVGDAQALPIADASVDCAFLIAVLPMIRGRQRALAELRRVLRPGGLLAVSEEILAPEYVPPAITRYWCQQAGFKALKQVRGRWCYLLTFRRV
ncbi:MAG: class I SAM-dependent methyltransferase [Chloroflexales bacterium]|nr:class I SAM-dependent methyltransferase [Chloroflexales bacterium]